MPWERVTSRNPWHVLLLLDDSESMAGPSARALNEALRGFINKLKLITQGRKPYFRVSIVKFGTQPETLCEAVSERELPVDKIATFEGNSGATFIGRAFQRAQEILRRNPGQATDYQPYVLVFSDGAPNDEDEAKVQANALKAMDIPAGRPGVLSIGIGNANDEFMQSLASSTYIRLKGANAIEEVFKEIIIGTVTSGVPVEAQVQQKKRTIVNL